MRAAQNFLSRTVAREGEQNFAELMVRGMQERAEEGFESDEETLNEDRPGSPEEALTNLEFDDPRAVDFRNYLRTWCVQVQFTHISCSRYDHLSLKVSQGTLVIHPPP